MYVLVLMLALAPWFDPIYTHTMYLMERDCVRELTEQEDAEAQDGVILIGKCVPKEQA